EDEEGLCAVADHRREGAVVVVEAICPYALKPQPQRAGRSLRVIQHARVGWTGRAPEDDHPSGSRDRLFEQLQLLPEHLGTKERPPRDVPAGSRQAGGQPGSHRIAVVRDDYGHGRRGGLGGMRCQGAARPDDVHLETDQFDRELWELTGLPFGGISTLDDEILALDVPELAQAPDESLPGLLRPAAAGRHGAQKPIRYTLAAI